MNRCASLLLVLSLFVALPAFAFVDEVYYQAELVQGDDLIVDVFGGMGDSCWELVGQTTNVVDNKLVVYIDTIKPVTGDYCSPTIVPYYVHAEFPALAAGEYILRIYENRPPLSPLVIDYPVSVASVVPTAPTAWGAIKALYR